MRSTSDRRLLVSLEEAGEFLAKSSGVLRRTLKIDEHHWDRLPGYRLDVRLLETSEGLAVRAAHRHDMHEDGIQWFNSPVGQLGQRFWVAEQWRFLGNGVVTYRADILSCGHSREALVHIRYQCNSPGTCAAVHSTSTCADCFRAGAGRPNDFGRELGRGALPPVGPWRPNTSLKFTRARSVAEVASLAVEPADAGWQWVIGWKKVDAPTQEVAHGR